MQQWLSEQDAYTLHKPVRTRFKRLVELSNLKQENDGITVTVIDVFSKRAWCVPLKDKSTSSLIAAFNTLLIDVVPTTLQTDKGLEFLNWTV